MIIAGPTDNIHSGNEIDAAAALDAWAQWDRQEQLDAAIDAALAEIVAADDAADGAV